MIAPLACPAPASACFLGADVSKDWVDLADTSGRSARVDNTPAALSAALSRPHWHCCANLVCEATGGYERALLSAATALGLPVRRIHPSRARAFARARGRLAKTDRIDAAVLAAMAAFTVGEIAPPLPSPAQQELAELMTRLGQLKHQRQAEQCRAQSTESPIVQRSIGASLAWLDSQIREIAAALDQAIAAEPDLARTAAILRTCKGIGPGACRALLAWLPELGSLNRRTVAALLGVAPITRHSGSSVRTAAIAGGRKPLRDLLFMAALSASRHNALFRNFYQRLRQAGKPHKLALIAVTRKLVTTLNAMVKDGKPFNPA